MIVVDTSLLVSFLSPNDPHHQKSLDWFESVLEQDLISPTLALVELAATFARAGYSISSTQSLINKAKSIINFESTDDCIQEAVFSALQCKCRGADSIFIGLALYNDCKLATLDIEQKNRGQLVVKVLDV